ncbi:MAG TPA: cytochrome P450 [Myxococcales bacterium]|nr:cytochrome P450 [Myxococcales bacterium]
MPRTPGQKMSATAAAPLYPGYPIIGVLPRFVRDTYRFIGEEVPRAGGLVRVKAGPMTFHVVSHPDHLQRILRDNFRNYLKRDAMAPLARISRGDSLTTMDGDPWLQRRRLLQPYFHHRSVHQLVSRMQQAVQDQVPYLDAWADGGRYQDAVDVLRDVTIRVFMRFFYGTTFTDEQTKQMGRQMGYAIRYTYFRYRFDFLPQWSPFPGKRAFEEAVASVARTTDEMLERKRGEAGAEDLLAMLVGAAEHGQMTRDELRAEVVGLFTGGWETASAVLSWVLYLLARDPALEARLSEEARRESAPAKAMEDVQRLALIRMTIQETMRLYPITPILSRTADAADEIGGYRIPAGSQLLLAISAAHRHPDFWERPEDFWPERFEGGAEAAARHPYAYLPFAAGPRQCIGMEFARLQMHLLLREVLARYRLQLEPGYTLRAATDATYMPAALPLRLARA